MRVTLIVGGVCVDRLTCSSKLYVSYAVKFGGELLNTVDQNGNTPLALALFKGQIKSAKLLVDAGADINERDWNGISLLMRTIRAKFDEASVFLLKSGARITEECFSDLDGYKCLALAVEHALANTVQYLVNSNVDLKSKIAGHNSTVLWAALQNDSFDIAKVLVANGCDMFGWSVNKDRHCMQTLLHKAIDLNMINAARFLIESGCDINESEHSVDGESSHLNTPLHLAIRRGMNDIALYLIKCGASLDKQDSNGQTAVHAAVYEGNEAILSEMLPVSSSSLLSVVDNEGKTPIAVAMQKQNFKMAALLLRKASRLVMEVNKDGKNLLHCAVEASDLESVLFLISSKTDVNACTQDTNQFTALHLSAQSGNEIIMRNLILAGADVNAVSTSGITPLHVAAINNHESLCMILLENGAEINAVDHLGNTPLHAAASRGSVASVNVLVGDERINLHALNKNGQTPLFFAAQDLSKTNPLNILQIFLNADPQYPLDARDKDGNTAFLIAYFKGNENMCRALLRCGICLSATNNDGISVFSHKTLTKQLLFSLLDNLEREPAWNNGAFCSECEAKFTLTMRKHHCRHCGRLVCARCSQQTMPILKYGIEKPVRVCQICCDILTMGPD